MKDEQINEKADFHRYELTFKIDKIYQEMLEANEKAVLEMRTLEKNPGRRRRKRTRTTS